jgi:large subunit ribosomal protein L30
MSSHKLAVVLIRGTVNLSPDVRKTLELLRLKNKHVCVVVDDNKVNRGMLQRVKDYVTYGEIDEKFYKEMLDKRAEMFGKLKVSESKEKVDTAKIAKDYFAGSISLRDFEEKGVKPFFRLSPPKGGFERKGIKMPYAKGGVLGNRGENMKDLIAKML